MTNTEALLFNPATYDPQHFDAETRRLLKATIEWFESRGKRQLLADDHNAVFTADFLEFVAKEKLFATFLTPAAYADGDENRRWDAARNAALSEIFGFYGLAYWYAEQVTILGLGPIWQSDNEAAKRRAAADLADGQVMAFALSEQSHGADIYNTDMVLTPTEPGSADAEAGILFRANGAKYYIGNGNVASMVSVFSRRGDIEGADGYIWFAADSRHENYHLIDNVVNEQMYVSTFRLENYPVRAEDILHAGPEAFSAALNTVNVGKFNLCHGGIGMVEHSFYEAITHANNRVLYGKLVTDFPHVRGNFVDAYSRIVAMKLFSDRAVDYFRTASLDDRRYLLFNPMTKSKVTSEGEVVMTLLLDVLAAKGFEKNTYFNEVQRLINTLPRLEGTVHVNVGQILKFLPNYLFNPKDYPEVGTRQDAADDEFFWRQGPARGAGRVQFADWNPVYQKHSDVANVARFYEQATALRELMATAAPGEAQQQDLDFMLTIGHLFSLVVYGQLILEQAAITGLDRDVLDQIFDFQIRDFNAHATTLYGKASATAAQREWAVAALRTPAIDRERFDRVWAQVASYDGAYEMRP
ncbi:acyl-CoA dehydrogenase family protein [Nocardia amikacinitolerans]|uniref:acyl-CoA dehydrogenase family protein n=1 Tax=Nocardia amikacinitolerans TaxID=756689 RepID=UPI0020A26638|nr:acyl-CoA dehydrogenase family protein [Nocardia amikacinitolerans]MCP2280171.1 acyl-CoA dehydrogenase [Nocardia amikacinitolerans]